MSELLEAFKKASTKRKSDAIFALLTYIMLCFIGGYLIGRTLLPISFIAGMIVFIIFMVVVNIVGRSIGREILIYLLKDDDSD